MVGLEAVPVSRPRYGISMLDPSTMVGYGVLLRSRAVGVICNHRVISTMVRTRIRGLVGLTFTRIGAIITTI